MGNSHRVSNAPIVRLLAAIGAIILVILAIMKFISPSLPGIIGGLLLMLVGIIVLISCFGSYKHGIPFTALFILIMGIVGCVIGFMFASWIGLIAGILILIAGIVGLM